ncbi:MAG: GTP 3',8-cyclase MoaA [Ferrimicrobium sp.]
MTYQPRQLLDRFGREIRDLRISVTDRCNFRCRYCMPEEGMNWLPRSELLTFEEVTRIAEIFTTHFRVGSIRLTGGEPTVRAQLPRLVRSLSTLVNAATGRPVDLALTTNGASLALIAENLRDAGLGRINISLDTLREDRFLEITKRPQLNAVLAGIDSAMNAGFDPVKINVVAMRGVNDDEILDFAEFGRQRGVIVRFIEFMPLDGSKEWTTQDVLSADEIVAAIDAKYPLEPITRTAAPATRYAYRDGGGEIGVIASVTRPFCGDCDRIRLSAEGKIRTCLFALDEHDLRNLMRSGANDQQIASAIEAIVGTKWAGHSIGNVNFRRPAKSMSQIGG